MIDLAARAIHAPSLEAEWYIFVPLVVFSAFLIFAGLALVVGKGKKVINVPVTIIGGAGMIVFATLLVVDTSTARDEAKDVLADQINEAYGLDVSASDAWTLYKGASLFVKHDGDQVKVQLVEKGDDTLVLIGANSDPLALK